MSIPITSTDTITFTEETPSVEFSSLDEALVRDFVDDHPNAADVFGVDAFSPIYGSPDWPHAYKEHDDAFALSESGMMEITASDWATTVEDVGDMSLLATEGTE